MQGLSLNELMILIVFVVCLVFVGAGAKAAWEDMPGWWAAFRTRYTIATPTGIAPAVSSVYDEDDGDNEETEQTNGANKQTNPDVLPSSALAEAIAARQVDIVKKIMVDSLVRDGANVALVRDVLKGDATALGVLVAESRARFGIEAAPRSIPVRAPGASGRMEEHEMIL